MRFGSPSPGKKTGEAPARQPSAQVNTAPAATVPPPTTTGALTDESQISFDPVDGHQHTGSDSHTVDHGNLVNVTSDQHHAKLHQADHQTGGADALQGIIDANGRLAIYQNGALVGTRRRLNIIVAEDAASLTGTDDSASEQVNLTLYTGEDELRSLVRSMLAYLVEQCDFEVSDQFEGELALAFEENGR